MSALARPYVPPIGLSRDEKHNYYLRTGSETLHLDAAPDVIRGPMPSVTAILRMLDKSGPLVGWAKRETAACAVRNLDMLTSMVANGGPDAAQRWLAGIPDYQRDTSADLGSRVHALADAVSKGIETVPTPEEAQFVIAYRRFLDDFEPRVLLSEFLVANLTHDYAGTADLAALIDGELWLLDIKTGKNVYPETAIQLAGYANAEIVGEPGDPVTYPLPAFERFGVLHLRPDGYELRPFEVGNRAFEAFLALRTAYAYAQTDMPEAIGEPLTPSRKEVAA
jgi:hypothetical protein